VTVLSPIASLALMLPPQVSATASAPVNFLDLLEALGNAAAAEQVDEESGPLVPPAKERRSDEPDAMAVVWAQVALIPINATLPSTDQIVPPAIDRDPEARLTRNEPAAESPLRSTSSKPSELIDLLPSIAPKANLAPDHTDQGRELPTPSPSEQFPSELELTVEVKQTPVPVSIVAPPIVPIVETPRNEVSVPPSIRGPAVEVAEVVEEVEGPTGKPATKGPPPASAHTEASQLLGAYQTIWRPGFSRFPNAAPEASAGPAMAAAPLAEIPPPIEKTPRIRVPAVPPEVLAGRPMPASSTDVPKLEPARTSQLAFAARLVHNAARPEFVEPNRASSKDSSPEQHGDRPADSDEPKSRKMPGARKAPDLEAQVDSRPSEQPLLGSQPAGTAEPNTPRKASPSPAEPVSPAAKVLPRPDISRPAPAARDIRIEVAGPERKVEVRLVERGGEVHLSVRTPDNRLASSLREDLPALSTRLEESGFRAEEWRTAEHDQVLRRLDPAGSSASSSDTPDEGRQQRGGHDQRHDDSPEPRETRESRRNKEKGTPFAWLMESLP
jgi:hypothetical protein